MASKRIHAYIVMIVIFGVACIFPNFMHQMEQHCLNIPSMQSSNVLYPMSSDSNLEPTSEPNVTVLYPLNNQTFARNPPDYCILVENSSPIIEMYYSIERDYWTENYSMESLNGTIHEELWGELNEGIYEFEFTVTDESHSDGSASVIIIKYDPWIPLARNLDLITIFLILPLMPVIGLGVFFIWKSGKKL